jgi:hypothetical protein
METLSKDIRRQLALKLSPPDLINFCLTSKENNEEICNSKDFWRQKLSIDYPEFFRYYQVNNLTLSNPKNTYIRKFTGISREIESIVKHYFSKNKSKEMYDRIYKFYVHLRNPSTNYEKDYQTYFGNFINNFENMFQTELVADEYEFKRELALVMYDLLKKDYIQGC